MDTAELQDAQVEQAPEIRTSKEGRFTCRQLRPQKSTSGGKPPLLLVLFQRACSVSATMLLTCLEATCFRENCQHFHLRGVNLKNHFHL